VREGEEESEGGGEMEWEDRGEGVGRERESSTDILARPSFVLKVFLVLIWGWGSRVQL